MINLRGQAVCVKVSVSIRQMGHVFVVFLFVKRQFIVLCQLVLKSVSSLSHQLSLQVKLRHESPIAHSGQVTQSWTRSTGVEPPECPVFGTQFRSFCSTGVEPPECPVFGTQFRREEAEDRILGLHVDTSFDWS